MLALATLAAILGCIALGLILTGIGWVISRWLGKEAASFDDEEMGATAPKPGRGEAAWSSGADSNSRTQGTSLTHSEVAP